MADDLLYDRIAALGDTPEGACPWDLYEVLGIARDASPKQVTSAYRRLALRFHPDKVPLEHRPRSERVFRAVARAYEVLGDQDKRLHYDAGDGTSFESSIGGPYEIFARTFFERRRQTDSDTRSGEWSLHSLANYDVYLAGEEPSHLRAIVRVGLNYLTTVLDLERKCVVLLRHRRMDQMWVMMAYNEDRELTQECFAGDGYIITYYDNPLQPGIRPRWSDQNVLGTGRPRSEELLAAKELSLDDYIERQEVARAELDALEAEERRQLRGG